MPIIAATYLLLFCITTAGDTCFPKDNNPTLADCQAVAANLLVKYPGGVWTCRGPFNTVVGMPQNYLTAQ